MTEPLLPASPSDAEPTVAERRKQIDETIGDIRAWLSGIATANRRGEIRPADQSSMLRELRAVEARLEQVTSEIILDR
jgi:hypothetical protein